MVWTAPAWRRFWFYYWRVGLFSFGFIMSKLVVE